MEQNKYGSAFNVSALLNGGSDDIANMQKNIDNLESMTDSKLKEYEYIRKGVNGLSDLFGKDPSAENPDGTGISRIINTYAKQDLMENRDKAEANIKNQEMAKIRQQEIELGRQYAIENQIYNESVAKTGMPMNQLEEHINKALVSKVEQATGGKTYIDSKTIQYYLENPHLVRNNGQITDQNGNLIGNADNAFFNGIRAIANDPKLMSAYTQLKTLKDKREALERGYYTPEQRRQMALDYRARNPFGLRNVNTPTLEKLFGNLDPNENYESQMLEIMQSKEKANAIGNHGPYGAMGGVGQIIENGNAIGGNSNRYGNGKPVNVSANAQLETPDEEIVPSDNNDINILENRLIEIDEEMKNHKVGENTNVLNAIGDDKERFQRVEVFNRAKGYNGSKVGNQDIFAKNTVQSIKELPDDILKTTTEEFSDFVGNNWDVMVAGVVAGGSGFALYKLMKNAIPKWRNKSDAEIAEMSPQEVKQAFRSMSPKDQAIFKQEVSKMHDDMGKNLVKQMGGTDENWNKYDNKTKRAYSNMALQIEKIDDPEFSKKVRADLSTKLKEAGWNKPPTFYQKLFNKTSNLISEIDKINSVTPSDFAKIVNDKMKKTGSKTIEIAGKVFHKAEDAYAYLKNSKPVELFDKLNNGNVGKLIKIGGTAFVIGSLMADGAHVASGSKGQFYDTAKKVGFTDRDFRMLEDIRDNYVKNEGRYEITNQRDENGNFISSGNQIQLEDYETEELEALRDKASKLLEKIENGETQGNLIQRGMEAGLNAMADISGVPREEETFAFQQVKAYIGALDEHIALRKQQEDYGVNRYHELQKEQDKTKAKLRELYTTNKTPEQRKLQKEIDDRNNLIKETQGLKKGSSQYNANVRKIAEQGNAIKDKNDTKRKEALEKRVQGLQLNVSSESGRNQSTKALSYAKGINSNTEDGADFIAKETGMKTEKLGGKSKSANFMAFTMAVAPGPNGSNNADNIDFISKAGSEATPFEKAGINLRKTLNHFKANRDKDNVISVSDIHTAMVDYGMAFTETEAYKYFESPVFEQYKDKLTKETKLMITNGYLGNTTEDIGIYGLLGAKIELYTIEHPNADMTDPENIKAMMNIDLKEFLYPKKKKK